MRADVSEGLISIIDIESSGLGPDSYPIQVAWNVGDELYSHYICSPCVPGWDHWSIQSEGLHGISREYLLQNGEAVESVAKTLNQSLKGQVVLSDAVEYDGFWCRRLFDATPYDMSFLFTDFWVYLRQFAPLGMRSDSEAEWQVRLLRQARNNTGNLREHLADHDVRIRLEAIRIAMNGASQ